MGELRVYFMFKTKFLVEDVNEDKEFYCYKFSSFVFLFRVVFYYLIYRVRGRFFFFLLECYVEWYWRFFNRIIKKKRLGSFCFNYWRKLFGSFFFFWEYKVRGRIRVSVVRFLFLVVLFFSYRLSSFRRFGDGGKFLFCV